MSGRGNVRVNITGDADGLRRETRAGEGYLQRLGRAGGRMGGMVTRGLRTAGLAAGAGLAIGLKKSADAAIESEKSQARLKTQLEAAGLSYEKYADRIDAVLQKQSQLSGLDDEDLQDSFTNIVRATGDVNEALRLNALAADYARAKGVEVADAGQLLAKVYSGNVGVLGRQGIAIDKVTTAQDRLKATNEDATDAQKRAAVEDDKRATAQRAIAVLQEKFAGQAEAYGKTTAGSMDRTAVAGENLGEVVGGYLTPIITKVAEALTRFIGQMQSGQGAGGKFVAVMKTIGAAIATVVRFLLEHENVAKAVGIAIAALTVTLGIYKAGVIAATTATKVATVASKAFAGAQALVNLALRANPIGLVVTALVALGAAFVVAYKKSETFRTIVDAAWAGIKAAAQTAWTVLKGIFGAMKTAIGGVGDAFEALKDVAADVLQFFKNRIADVLGLIQKLYEVASGLPGRVGDKFAQAAKGIQQMRWELDGTAKKMAEAKRVAQDLQVALMNVYTAARNAHMEASKTRPHDSQQRRSKAASPAPSRDAAGGWPDHHDADTRAAAASGALIAKKRKKRDKPTRLDYIEAAIAEAALEPAVNEADTAAADRLVTYWKNRLKAARRKKDPRKIEEAAQALLAAQSAREDLNTAAEDAAAALLQQLIDAQTAANEQAAAHHAELMAAQEAAAAEQRELERQRIEIEKARADAALRALATSEAQYPAFMAALLDSFNGMLGDRLGIARATPSAPGVGAAY